LVAFRKLRERKQLGKDSNFGQQTYMYSAPKALDRIYASIAMAVVVRIRADLRVPQRCGPSNLGA